MQIWWMHFKDYRSVIEAHGVDHRAMCLSGSANRLD